MTCIQCQKHVFHLLPSLFFRIRQLKGNRSQLIQGDGNRRTDAELCRTRTRGPNLHSKWQFLALLQRAPLVFLRKLILHIALDDFGQDLLLSQHGSRMLYVTKSGNPTQHPSTRRQKDYLTGCMNSKGLADPLLYQNFQRTSLIKIFSFPENTAFHLLA